MPESKCTNCGAPGPYYCAHCEGIRDKLEKLRREQRDGVAARNRNGWRRKKPKRVIKVGAYFMQQCAKYGAQLQAEGKLPLSGQDAALPIGDRD